MRGPILTPARTHTRTAAHFTSNAAACDYHLLGESGRPRFWSVLNGRVEALFAAVAEGSSYFSYGGDAGDNNRGHSTQGRGGVSVSSAAPSNRTGAGANKAAAGKGGVAVDEVGRAQSFCLWDQNGRKRGFESVFATVMDRALLGGRGTGFAACLKRVPECKKIVLTGPREG